MADQDINLQSGATGKDIELSQSSTPPPVMLTNGYALKIGTYIIRAPG